MPHADHFRPPGFTVAEAKNVKRRLLAAVSPARCYHWRYCVAAGRLRSTARTTSPPGALPAINRGALYPLLSKHDAAINRFFPTAFTFARRLYDALPVSFDHDWCGVTQLGWDEKSQQKIARMLSLALPAGLASALNAEETTQAVGVTTRCGGITYPAGGWLCPEQLTRAVIALATEQGFTNALSPYAHVARCAEVAVATALCVR
ncbi:protein YfcK [Salmonella enterica subsp. arizonae]|uniref:Protein YfcK n=1 Tax=Salmonella enterica subsp. arizonae TaxID=59203 RepID=A0A379SPV8_SALER|nr:protein YfcK [Salmonella enterica subsp. arizonae]